MDRKKPRFFCDNCSAEVRADAKACQSCGRLFASVRCPSCGHVGGDEAFVRGCPSCGLAAPPPIETAPRPRRRKRERQGLPPWALFLSIGICVFVMAALFLTLM